MCCFAVKMTASEDNYAGGQSYFTYLVEYNCPVAFFEIEEDVNCTRDAGFVMKSDISSVNVESVKGLKLVTSLLILVINHENMKKDHCMSFNARQHVKENIHTVPRVFRDILCSSYLELRLFSGVVQLEVGDL